MEEIKRSVNGEMPWIVFNLCQSKFAVSSDMVSGMTEVPSEIISVPSDNKALAGVSVIRGQIVPLINLREFFGMKSLEDEYESFKEMLDQRKKEHIEWTNELKRCLETGDNFGLITDPHQCKFGTWIDEFSSERNDLNAHVAHISKPHSKLHKVAQEIFAEGISDAEKEGMLYEAEFFYMPKILSLIEEAKDVFKENFKGIVLLVQPEGSEKTIGLMCDEVYSVEETNIVFQGNVLRRLYASPYICGIGHTQRVDGEIVMLDAERMLDLYPDIDFTPAKAEEPEQTEESETAEDTETAEATE